MNKNLSVSQNFLVSNFLVRKIINKINLNKNNLIVEIGVGDGMIAKELVQTGYEVLGYELDPKLYENLVQNLNFSNLKIVKQDFLTARLKNEINKEFSIFSNIPFNQTTKIVQKILIDEPLAQEIYLIMQEEAADRFLGKKEGLLLSLLILNNYSAEIIYKFRKTDFKPVPKVNIVLTKFIKREKPLIETEKYQKFLDFICYIVMQQKPTLIDRLSKTLNYFALKDFMHLLKIEPFLSLYQVPKLKYFEMFELFMKKHSSKMEIFTGSYKNYQYINQKNKKVFQTRK